MHVQEPGDLVEGYILVDAHGKLSRRGWMIDGLPSSMDVELQRHRKRPRPARGRGPILGSATGRLSASRSAAAGRLGFAVERDYDVEAQIMAMPVEGIDIAVLFPTGGAA